MQKTKKKRPEPGSASSSMIVNKLSRVMLKRLVNKWKSYRHRFVPWMMFNLSNNERTLRQVTDHSKDKLVRDQEVLDSLLLLFRALLHKHVAELPSQTRTFYLTHCTEKITEEDMHAGEPVTECDIMFKTMGFCIEKRPSSLPSAGAGVFVTKGLVPKGTTVAMYPGAIYQAYQPIFIQSIRNPFVFRCIDGVFVDGNDRGISKVVYRSCGGRDRVGAFQLCDSSWLTHGPKNPLAMGQYVNNCSNECSANVCYQEFDVPDSFPLELRQYLPNVNYTHDVHRPLRCVVLVSLRDIGAGEELFSNYYTIVH